MKKFLSLISIAVVMLMVASAMLLIPTAAETEVVNSKNVVFISDAVKDLAAGMTQAQAVATYDGSSADKPLYPTPAPSYEVKESAGVGRYYLNTALYQAAEKLLDTGGTIVICGTVRIDDDDAYGSTWDKDFIFPESDRRITITNVYNGIDYRTTNSARFEIGGAVNLLLGSPVTMENIKIKCTTRGRLICAQGNDLVMGEGITNELPSGKTSGYYYPSIVGGKRFGDLDSDTNVTIKSGSYGLVSGSSWGNNNANPSCQNGDVNLNLLGGTYTSFICGISARKVVFNANETSPDGNYNASNSSVYVNGDINITIGGSAVIKSFVYALSPARFGEAGHSVYIKVLGGQFSSGTYLRNEWTATTMTIPEGTGIAPDSIVLDMSDANVVGATDAAKNTVLNDMINQNKSAMQILYPAKWLQTYTINTYPSNSTVFKGDSVTSKGASLTLNFKNLKDNATTYTQTVTYDGKVAAFKVECDTSENGTATTSYKYGTTEYHTEQTTVVQTPDVSILGARLRITKDTALTNQTEQTLRFVANYTANGVTVTDKGVLVVKAYMLSSPEKLTFEDTYGLFDCKPATGAEYSVGNLRNFECDFDGINQGEFNTDYYVRAYVKYTHNGETHVKYSDVITRNPYTVALQATADGSTETAATKTYLQTNLIDAFDNFSVNTMYDQTAATEFRNTVVNYAQMQATFAWTPSETFAFYNDGSDYGVANIAIYEKGQTYYGIPYASSGWSERRTSNYEHFMSLLDSSSGTNVFPMTFGDYETRNTLTPFVKTKCASSGHFLHSTIADCVNAYDLKTKGYFANQFDSTEKAAAIENYIMFPGSHCAQVLFTAWNNVIDNKATVQRLAYTSNMVPGHNSGSIPVGDYLYKYEDVYANSADDEVKYRSDTGKMVEVSGTATMYAAYDNLQPGDCLIHYVYGEYSQDATYGAGHARMVLSVNPTAKTVTTLECANWNVPYENIKSGDGTSTAYEKTNTSWRTLTYNYDYLIETAFVPVTIKELTTGLSDKQSVILTDTNLAETLSSGTIDGLVKSNKSIDGVRILIKDASGNTVYDRMAYLLDESRHLAGYDLEELGVDFSDKLTSGVSYKFTFEVNTATSVDNIALVTDYAFIAK